MDTKHRGKIMRKESLPFQEMNNWTYEYNQQGLAERHSLIETIKKTGSLSYERARVAARSACYLTSLVFDIWFKGVEKANIGIKDIFKWLYDTDSFVPETSYQMRSSKDILAHMKKDGIIQDYNFTDVDYRYGNCNREIVFKELIDYMQSPDFTCARVCFGADASSDHALIVTNDELGRAVVCDTSWRGHDWPDNRMIDYINAETIRWFTSVELS